MPPTPRWSPEYEGKEEITGSPSAKCLCQSTNRQFIVGFNQCNREVNDELRPTSGMQRYTGETLVITSETQAE
ncbi:hypothetical protein HAX54_029026, partial [Datura stramonium]|nr:hypothetical protein [Datura stramonium]